MYRIKSVTGIFAWRVPLNSQASFVCNTEKWNKIRLSTFDAMSGSGILVFQLRIVFLARNYYLQGYGCGELYAPVYRLIDNY